MFYFIRKWRLEKKKRKMLENHSKKDLNVEHYINTSFPEKPEPTKPEPAKPEPTKTDSVKETKITKEWMQSQQEKMRAFAPEKENCNPADERIEIGCFWTETEPSAKCLIYYDYENNQFYVHNKKLDTLTAVAIDEFPIVYLEYNQKIFFLGKGDIMSKYAHYSPATCGYPEYHWKYHEAVVLSSGIEIKESPVWYGFDKISKSEKPLKEFIPPKKV